MEPLDLEQANELYFARIHRAALLLTGSPWDADDLAQETFLVLAREGHKFRGESHLYTYLYGILLNLERRQRRRNGVWLRKLRVLWGNAPAEPRHVPSPETGAEASEWKRSLWAEVAKLPDGQREALVLRFGEHMSYEEIAVVLNCPVGTVKSRIHNGLASMRDRMTAAHGEDAQHVPDAPGEDVANAV